MGAEIAALFAFFGLGGFFATLGAAFAGWMAWRIVEKSGLPGWAGLGSVLLTLTGVGSIVPLVLLWVFAFMRWPRDEPAPVGALSFAPGTAAGGPPQALPPPPLTSPPAALADRRVWRLDGPGIQLTVDAGPGGFLTSYTLTGSPRGASTGATARSDELCVPDPSVGRPHARLLVVGTRLGLEDLGSAGGTWVDGARLLPEHGPRDLSQARAIRLGNVDLVLSRA